MNTKCVRCGSYAINPGHHDRPEYNEDIDHDLCDVCFWRKRAERTGAEVKHYYSDDGCLNYTISDRSMLIVLAKVIGIRRLHSERLRPKLAYQVINAASGLLISYGISLDMGESGVGGCKTVEEFKKHTPADPLEAALLPFFLDMLDQGILPNYFVLVALNIFVALVIDTYDWGDK